MSKARIHFNYPTKTRLGSELPPSAIAGAELTVKGPQDSGFKPLGTVAYPSKEFVTAELEFGTYVFRGVCVRTNGKKSVSPAEATLVVTDESEPEVLLDLSAVVEA